MDINLYRKNAGVLPDKIEYVKPSIRDAVLNIHPQVIPPLICNVAYKQILRSENEKNEEVLPKNGEFQFRYSIEIKFFSNSDALIV